LRPGRDDETAAWAYGKNVAIIKTTAVVVSSALAAVAGSLYAFYLSFINVESFVLDTSIQLMAMVIIGVAPKLFQHLLQPIRPLQRQPDRGLIHEQTARPGQEGAPDRHHLLLAPRKETGAPMIERADRRQHLQDPFDALGARSLGKPRATSILLIEQNVREALKILRSCRGDEGGCHHPRGIAGRAAMPG
jgi:hypothetical protein